MRRALEVLCLVLASAGCAAQGLRICTLAGCNSGFRIEFVGMPSAPPEGRFLVEARINGHLVACSIAVTQDREAVNVCQSSTGAPWVELSLQASNQYIAIQGSAPRHVQVTLSYEGRVVGETQIAPAKYEVFEPNGHECGPICLIAGPYSMPLTSLQIEG